MPTVLLIQKKQTEKISQTSDSAMIPPILFDVKPSMRLPHRSSYIANEINKNIRHPAVIKMKALNSYDAEAEARRHFELPLSQRLGIPPDFYRIELVKKAEALVLWTERVGQNRPWDHKPIIRETIGGIRHKQGDYEYFYDIWSNIHYGYVGMAAGFSETLLLDGEVSSKLHPTLSGKSMKCSINPCPNGGFLAPLVRLGSKVGGLGMMLRIAPLSVSA